jgi:hypothetical protein
MEETLSETETETPVEAPETPAETEPVNPDAEPVEPIEGPVTPGDEPEPAPEPEPSSLAKTVEQEKKLEAEQKRHTGRVGDILGEAANEVVLCPFCDPQMQGFFYMGDLENPRDEMQGRMAIAYLQPEQAEFEPARDVETCTQCKGYGKTATGSKVPGNETKACANCKGYGFYPPPTLNRNGNVGQDAERELALVGAPPAIVEDVDAWGSPRLMPDGQENPNYGKMPQYKNPDLP